MFRVDQRSIFITFNLQFQNWYMDDPDQKIKLQLGNAQQLFKSGEYAQCRKLLSDIKATHVSIELNSLLCEYKENPQKIASILKKMMDILVAINIKIYQQRPNSQTNGKKNQIKTPKISHEFYFWNIIVLAQLLPNVEIAQLVASQALHFTDSLRTESSLMILYQMLSTMQSSSRLASCISLIEQQNKLISRVKKLNSTQQAYRFLNQILSCKVLLKLGMIEDSRVMYMMKFNQNLQEGKEDQELSVINSIHIKFYQQLLHAEIEYHAKNYSQSLKILGEITPQIETSNIKRQFLKNIVDHNIALVLINYKNVASAQLFMKKTINYLTSNPKQLESNTEKNSLITKCKENLLLSMLESPSKNYQQGFQLLKQTQNSYSFKINYRKAQLCLNYYHQLLRSPQKVVAYKDIHDFYQTVYYYPNLPYFQQKGKNKNPNYTNGKFFYRRYVLTPWQHDNPPKQEFVSFSQKVANQISEKVQKQERKEPSKEKKNEKGISKNKKGNKKQEQVKEDLVKEEIIIKKDQSFEGVIRQILGMAECFLKESLVILQKEKSIIVNFEEEEKGYTQQVNQKLYNEYIAYKSNILSLLCYLYLCKREWIKTVRYAQQYQLFEKQYQLNSKNSTQQKIHYNVLTYKTQALCELSRIDKAYETLQDIIPVVDYTQTTTLQSRSTSSHQKGQTYFEKSSQYNNFGFNLSVLHSRDNKIPQAYNSIQKLLQQMRVIPSNPTANLPLSLIELLIHYNMRTGNSQSALQMVKRRRILNLPGVIGHYQPLLNVTK